MVEPTVRYTWRVSRPINRDAVCLQLFKYEWDAAPGQSERHSYILCLEPEPHWLEYEEHASIPESTVEIEGLALIHLIGGYKDQQLVLPNLDLRRTLEAKIDSRIEQAIRAFMHVEPAVVFQHEAG